MNSEHMSFLLSSIVNPPAVGTRAVANSKRALTMWHLCNVCAQQRYITTSAPVSPPYDTLDCHDTDQYYLERLLHWPPVPFTKLSQRSRPYLPHRMAITPSFAHFARAITEMLHSVISFVTGVLFRWPIQVIVELVNILAGLIHSVLGILTGEPQRYW